MFLSRDLVCNQPLVCDSGVNSASYYYYYNNSCRLVQSSCHLSTNSSHLLFDNISHCIAMCNNSTGELCVCVFVCLCVCVCVCVYLVR